MKSFDFFKVFVALLFGTLLLALLTAFTSNVSRIFPEEKQAWYDRGQCTLVMAVVERASIGTDCIRFTVQGHGEFIYRGTWKFPELAEHLNRAIRQKQGLGITYDLIKDEQRIVALHQENRDILWTSYPGIGEKN